MPGLQCFDETGFLTFEVGDSLARITLTGQTGGAKEGQAYVPQWEPATGNRPWFTTVNPAGYDSNYRQPNFRIQAPFLQWSMDYPQDPPGAPDIKYICGIW